MHTIATTLAVGIGATVVMDLWVALRTRGFGTRPPDYALLGRWFGHLARGRFRHDAIAQAAPVRGERVLGWAGHYATGIAFAVLLVALAGEAWLRAPTPGPALAVGIATVAAPFLLLHPGMGLGLAARRAPRPNAIRAQSLVTHFVFGAGLYASAWLVATLRAAFN